MLPHMALAMNLSILFEVIWRIGGKELGAIILIAPTQMLHVASSKVLF